MSQHHTPAPEIRTSPLHRTFGVEVHNVDLRRATQTVLYPALRDLFERHSLLLFRNQHLDDDEHLAFSQLIGPIEDRSHPLLNADLIFGADEFGQCTALPQP